MSFRKVVYGAITISLLVLFTISGCTTLKTKSRGPTFSAQDPVAFLQQYRVSVEASPTVLTVKVPKNWDVPLGVYPEGLFWGLANTFSKDVGLDLTGLKGKTVEARVYKLTEGLHGPGESARYQYPSTAIVLMDNKRIVGAWLSFDTLDVGPSLRKRTLEDLTGLTFKQWLEREEYFKDAGKNADLAQMNPTEVLDAFFAAIEKGDKTRAQACMSPRDLLNSLTVNRGPGQLYNPGFGTNNSMVENILEARPISYRYLDPDNPTVELKNAGGGDRAEIAVELYLKWRDAAFNTATDKAIRFAILEKYANGWKLEGLGTGP